MSVHYTEDFKKEVVKAYMAGDKSIPQIAVEFNVAKSSVSKWVNEYKEECLYTTSTTAESNEAKEISFLMKKIKRSYEFYDVIASRIHSNGCGKFYRF